MSEAPPRGSLILLIVVLLGLAVATPALAADVAGDQRRAAEQYLAAVAARDPAAMAQAIHPDELELLRKRIVDLVRLEDDRGENATRSRLFGPSLPVDDIQRLTPLTMFTTLAKRLSFGGRAYERYDWLAAVGDDGGLVHAIGRGRLPRENGSVRPTVLVSLVPWGKDWKAAVPFELQAQIDDLIAGRGAAAAQLRATPGSAGGNTQPMLALFDAAEANLAAGRCEDYYDDDLSPNFRRMTATRALKSLIAACTNRPEVRETLLAALRAARTAEPRYEYGGTRAVYDLSGQGLPFSRFAIEQVDKRWYVAE
jgi:hypothetical protein